MRCQVKTQTSLARCMYVNTPNKHQFSFDCPWLLHFSSPLWGRKKTVQFVTVHSVEHTCQNVFQILSWWKANTTHERLYKLSTSTHMRYPQFAGPLQEFRKSNRCIKKKKKTHSWFSKWQKKAVYLLEESRNLLQLKPVEDKHIIHGSHSQHRHALFLP